MSEITELSLTELRKGLDRKEFSSVELCDAYLARMEQYKSLNAYITETRENAKAQAVRSDQEIAAGRSKALTGVPIGIKDLFCTKGVRTTAASKILHDFIPPYESVITQKLFDAGAVCLGKLNLDEFAMGSTNATSYFGRVVSPWRKKSAPDLELTAGGSSGGSAAAVSARLCAFATGTDTGGSIRQPAAFTGTFGIKPTYGRCSRRGVVAFASSLDQAGPITRTVRDGALALSLMSGYDAGDSTSYPEIAPDFVQNLTDNVKGLRIGVPKEYRMNGLDQEIIQSWEDGIKILRDAGAEIHEISLPHTEYALPAYYIIAPAEASSNLARYDGVKYGLRVEGADIHEMYENTRGEGFGDEVKRRIFIGTFVLSSGYYDAYYTKAQKVKTLIKRDFTEVFEKVDAIVTPSTPGTAFGFDEKDNDPIKMYLNDVFTVTANLAGLPAASVPVRLSADGLPLGLQVIGKPFDEQTTLNVCLALESGFAFRASPFSV